MRLLYSRFLYHYDIELCPEDADWLRSQKSWTLWFKGDLNIRITTKHQPSA